MATQQERQPETQQRHIRFGCRGGTWQARADNAVVTPDSQNTCYLKKSGLVVVATFKARGCQKHQWATPNNQQHLHPTVMWHGNATTPTTQWSNPKQPATPSSNSDVHQQLSGVWQPSESPTTRYKNKV